MLHYIILRILSQLFCHATLGASVHRGTAGWHLVVSDFSANKAMKCTEDLINLGEEMAAKILIVPVEEKWGKQWSRERHNCLSYHRLFP